MDASTAPYIILPPCLFIIILLAPFIIPTLLRRHSTIFSFSLFSFTPLILFSMSFSFFLSFFLSLVCSFSCFAENLSSFLFLFLHLSHTDYSILVPMDSLVLIFCLFRRRSDSCCTEKSCNLFLKNYYTGFYVYRYIYIKFVNIT